MTDISHHTTKELVTALRNAAKHSTTPDLLTEAADRLDPMQELADLWRAEEKANDQAAVIAQMREALEACLASLERANSTEGVCCCGADMETHSEPMVCGHSPVDLGEYYADKAIEAARAALEAGK